MTRYVPEFVPQMDGTRCEDSNCWSAVGCMAADAASGGERTPTPSQFRGLAGKAGARCETGGLSDIIRGLMNMGLWGRRTRYRVDVPKADVRAFLMRRSGNVVCMETDFQDWPEVTVCQPSFNDKDNAYHSIAVICGEGTGDNRHKVRVGNSLCQRWRWVDVDEVIHAAVVYNDEHRETRGTIDLIVVTPPLR